jgi:hypothetical protein
MSLRDLIRSFATWPWESEQAVEFAWLLIKTPPFLNEMAVGGHEILRRNKSHEWREDLQDFVPIGNCEPLSAPDKSIPEGF